MIPMYLLVNTNRHLLTHGIQHDGVAYIERHRMYYWLIWALDVSESCLSCRTNVPSPAKSLGLHHKIPTACSQRHSFYISRGSITKTHFGMPLHASQLCRLARGVRKIVLNRSKQSYVGNTVHTSQAHNSHHNGMPH